MKRNFLLYIGATAALFFAMSLLKGWINIAYWQLWVGGLMGIFLPDIDHFIYIYFLKPHELTSQRVSKMVDDKNISGAISLVSETTKERERLILHSFLFQMIFLVLTFWVITSTSGYLGRGLVLAFSIHLAIDQWQDYKRYGNINNWFQNFATLVNPLQTKNYIRFVFGIILVFAFLF